MATQARKALRSGLDSESRRSYPCLRRAEASVASSTGVLPEISLLTQGGLAISRYFHEVARAIPACAGRTLRRCLTASRWASYPCLRWADFMRWTRRTSSFELSPLSGGRTDTRGQIRTDTPSYSCSRRADRDKRGATRRIPELSPLTRSEHSLISASQQRHRAIPAYAERTSREIIDIAIKLELSLLMQDGRLVFKRDKHHA
jgi:hypothetical protein